MTKKATSSQVERRPRWVGLAEAAKYVGSSPATLRSMIANGDLPASRFGVELRLDLNRIDDFLDSNPVTGSAPGRGPGRGRKKRRSRKRVGSA